MGGLIKETQSVCPVCLGRINAAYVERAGRVWLEKTCPSHGHFEAPVWEAAAGFAAWVRESPAQPPAPPLRRADKGCPYDCGLCENHRQAGCCVLLEVSARCDLGCPVCYAAAGGTQPPDPPLETVLGWLDMLMARGGPFNIQLSGGEPTMRDDLDRIIAAGREKGFAFFQLNTNGLRIARQPGYIEGLAGAGLNTVFLQFDTLDGAACTALRGQDLVAEKKRAVQACAAAGVGVVLVPTVKPGVNLGGMGALLDYAAANMPAVRGVHFQPISYFGRYGAAPQPGDRLTIPALLAELERQTGGRVKAADFCPGSAEHALCTFHAEYTVAGTAWTAKPAPASAGCCPPRPSSQRARDAVALKWSAPAPSAAAGLTDRYDLSALDDFLAQKKRHTLALSGMAFQDAWTVDLERLCRCHVHVVAPHGRLVPFCAHNLTAADGRALHGRG